MTSKRQLVVSVVFAAAALALLGGVLWWERAHPPATWSAMPSGKPVRGAALFKDKGCVRCHAIKGSGGNSAPELGSDLDVRRTPSQLVVSMWNHAPRMWAQMKAKEIAYPKLGEQEVADLFAYLYTARCIDETGDAERGGRLFELKGCNRCHGGRTVPTKESPPSLDSLRSSASPVAWARAMWNHPPLPNDEEPPQFEARDMNDVMAFARKGQSIGLDWLLVAADADRGWKLYREKACVTCHSLRGEAGRVGPDLGPGRELPATIVQLAGSMWNHSLAMSRAMNAKGVKRPRFSDAEMADLIAFLYSIRASEPGGSATLGEVTFDGRGCGSCHGPHGDGTESAPGLRGKDRRYSSISLGTALWQHGPEMNKRVVEKGVKWPDLSEGDVGDLIAFLNSAPAGRS